MRKAKKTSEKKPASFATSLRPGSPNPAVVFAAFCLLGLTALAFSDASIPQLPNNNLFGGSSSYGPLISVIIVGLAIVVAAVAGIYMLAASLRQAEWQAMVKGEMYQAVISVVWGLVLFGAAVGVDGVTSRFAGKAGLFDSATGYINQVICLSSTSTIKLEGLKIGAQYLSSMRGRHYAGPWGMSVPLYPGWEIVERALDLIQAFTMPFTSSLYVQNLGLQIIHSAALTLILPAGILMRVFTQTRDAGSFLIASAFGFYFVFPFMYVINANVMNGLYQNQFGYPMCGGGTDNGNAQMLASQQLYKGVSGQLAPSATQDFIGFKDVGLMPSLSYVVFQSVFLPALAMVVTVTFIRNALKFFAQKME